MTRQLAFLCLCCLEPAAVWAQSGIVAPRAGCVQDRTGALRTLFGVSGVFVAGDVVQTGVVSAACSSQLTLAKTATALEARDASMQLIGRWPAPSGPARFAFPRSGAAAFVYFEHTRELRYFDGKRTLRTLALPDALEGDVLALAVPDALHLIAVVRGASGVSLVRIQAFRALVEQVIPLEGTPDAVFVDRDGTLILTEGTGVVIRRPNRAEQRLALPAAAAGMAQIGDDFAGISLAGGAAPAVLDLREGREKVLRIPEAVR
jgi:hypothetical protein